MAKKIGFFVGSLRKDSINRIYANALANLLPSEYEASFIAIHDLPLFNEDADSDDPEQWPEAVARLRAATDEAVGFIFVTPEYNRSIPGALKNALDIASRPAGSTRFSGKPSLIATASPSPYGGFNSNQHLRQVLALFNAPVVTQPELYISNAHTHISNNGELTSSAIERLQNGIDAFAALLHTYSH